MSVIAWSQTSIIRKGGLHTKRGSQIHARKKEAKKKGSETGEQQK